MTRDDHPERERSDDAGREEGLGRETLFDILSSSRRRRVVRYLLQHPQHTDFRTLTDELAALEAGTTVDRLDGDQRKPVYVSLRQTHLPKLDDAGVIDYDRDRGTIVPRPLLSSLEAPLRAADRVVGETASLGRPHSGRTPEDARGVTVDGDRGGVRTDANERADDDD